MALTQYETKKIGPERMAVIDVANAICQQYAAQGLVLTLRQLYYQFVARGWLPNRQRGQPVMEEALVPTTDARIWRSNFYRGFIHRTAMRLLDARRQAMRDAGVDMADEQDSKALAIRDKRKDVREAFEEAERFVLSSGRTYSGSKVTNYSHDGNLAGDSAGQRARLGNEKDLDHG